MICVLIIAVASCAGMIALTLFKPKICIKGICFSPYWLATLLGASFLFAFQLVKPIEAFNELTSDTAINPIKILVLFISMAILSIFLDETGFFKYLANAVLKNMGSSQVKLFTTFYITTSVLTVFTSNDIIILTFTPFICYFAKNAKINPLPYLISEFVAANTCSMLLIIGNPTNIYIATAQGIHFFEYLKVMILPTLFAGIVAYFAMLLLFYKRLKTPISNSNEQVKIEQKTLLTLGVVILSVCTVLLAVSSYINLEMWLIATVSAASLILAVLGLGLIKRKRTPELGRALKRAPWELIPFVISMFIIVLSLNKYQVTDRIAAFLGGRNAIFTYGSASVLFANLINNIPMSVLFTSVLQNLSQDVAMQGTYAVIIGSNIGAYLSPIGALAGIMWLQIIKSNNIEFNFLQFLKYGALIAVPTLVSALLGLTLATMWIYA